MDWYIINKTIYLLMNSFFFLKLCCRYFLNSKNKMVFEKLINNTKIKRFYFLIPYYKTMSHLCMYTYH